METSFRPEQPYYSVEGNPELKSTGKVETRGGGREDLLKVCLEKEVSGGWIDFHPNTVNGSKQLPTFADVNKYYDSKNPFTLFLFESGKLEGGFKLKREKVDDRYIYKSKELGKTFDIDDVLPDDYILEFFIPPEDQPLLKGF